ncbi:class A sortase [Enterococcus sp. JM4C]|uniref:class A sortase n=1 Tax=Candidatus Enterococcus huntleyi TaxID=1857217 RepID=UPI00137B3F9D|nr:class A sortase [Enterococcus sp. JM4C]KAF1295225.1 class A sortase [Enterococcus sp. JM4C]
MANRRKIRKKKQRSRVANWLINIGLILLLVVGLALVFNNQIKNFLIKQNGESYAIASYTSKQLEENKNKDTTFDFEGVESISTEAVLRAQFANKRLPIIGGIAIPSVKINLPIFNGLSNEALLWGAGTMSPDQIMGQGNYGLASHRAYEPDLLFTPLENVKTGEKIYITDLKNIYTYTTTVKRQVEPTEVEVLDVVEGKKLITLVTCAEIEGINRIVVQGELESITSVDKASETMVKAFEIEQKTY